MERIPDLVAQCLACLVLCIVVATTIIPAESISSSVIAPHASLLIATIVIALGLMLTLSMLAITSSAVGTPATLYISLAAILVLLAPLCILITFTPYGVLLAAQLLSAAPTIICALLATGLACTVHTTMHTTLAIPILIALFLPTSPLAATLIIAFLAARTLHTNWAAVALIAILAANTPALKSVHNFVKNITHSLTTRLQQSAQPDPIPTTTFGLTSNSSLEHLQQSPFARNDVEQQYDITSASPSVNQRVICASWRSLFDQGVLRTESKTMQKILMHAQCYKSVYIEFFLEDSIDTTHAVTQLYTFLAEHDLIVHYTLSTSSGFSGIKFTMANRRS